MLGTAWLGAFIAGVAALTLWQLRAARARA
jgi:hypothetical protein